MKEMFISKECHRYISSLVEKSGKLPMSNLILNKMVFAFSTMFGIGVYLVLQGNDMQALSETWT